MLCAAVGASAVLETRKGVTEELESQAIRVRRTFDAAMQRAANRTRQDASLLAERPAVAMALERRRHADFSRETIPFAIEKGYDMVAIVAPSGEDVFVNGSTSLTRRAPARMLVRRGALGIPGSTVTVTVDGAVIVYAAVPVRSARGIVGLVLIAQRLGPAALAEIAKPLDATLAVSRSGTHPAAPADVAGAHAYSYLVELGDSRATLHVFVSGADLARATRSAFLAAAGIGFAFILGLILLIRTLLNRAVSQPLRSLRAAINEIWRGGEEVRVIPAGARELREVGDGFNRMIGALHAETAFRRGVMDAVTDGIFSLDLEGRLTLVNRRACELTGLEPDDLIGRTTKELMTDLLSPADGIRVRTAMTAVVGQADPARVDGVELQRKDGMYRLVNLSFTGLGDGSRTTGAVVTAEDVTERALLEQQLLQSRKLEAIGQLAGGIAHDFNNLLTGIIGYSELLLAETTPADPSYEPLGAIKQTGEQAAALTGQLLAFSRKQVIQPKVLDLNEIVRCAQKLLTRLIGEEIELVVALARPLGPVEADPAQLEQMIMNLVLNARDAMPRGGTITVETAEVESAEIATSRERLEVDSGSYVVLTVSDTGAGIELAIQDRLFEPFFTTKDPGRGTGLGLSTVYGIVKQSGGYVFVDSAPGQGAIFRVYLPRISSPLTLPVPEQIRGGSRGSETVLLVDDSGVVRDVARAALEGSGYRVLEAADGQAALELCGEIEETIDLVLTDVVMPRMGGRELADRLRALLPGLRVIFTSGYIDDATLREDLVEGGTFLRKPFSVAELTSLVRSVLDAPAPSDHAPAVRIR
ncbi:MAG: ATP-binding protein [Gaiellaceae bacterium]